MRLRDMLCLSVALIFLGAATTALADVPQTINLQGILLDDNGDPVTTTSSVIFAIWNAATDGDSLWSEPRSVTPDDEGRFTILFGETVQIPQAVFEEPNRWLSIKVEDDPEMSPRTRLSSVAYSYRSATADAGGGNSGWVDDGAVVRLETDTDNVGIGTVSPNSTLDIDGSFSVGFYSVPLSTDYTATDADCVISFCCGGARTLHLPTAVGIVGRLYIIKNLGSETISIDPDGTETIDGIAVYYLTVMYQGITIVSDGANWLVIGTVGI